MKVGLFDHVERSDRPLATLFDERLEFAAAADRAGFYCLHVAEHHCTPLNMVPVPGIYLGALARATERIRLGPLVYLLPLYSPLRLAEEICMLDHLSRGRFEIGVGRGVSPFELNFHKIDHEQSREIFIEAFACLQAALAHETFSFNGERYRYENVPMAMRPLQDPMPAFWYGSSNVASSAWAGEQGLHFTTNGGTARAGENIAAFRTALVRRGGPVRPKAEFAGGAAIGVLRHIVVADTDEDAERIARPAFERHLANLNWLRDRAASEEFTQRLNVHSGIDFETCRKNGMLIVGSPEKVLSEIIAQHAELDVNYLLAYLMFGTMSLPDALRSLRLFETEIMPKIASL